jgi:hypothetical protein
MTKRIFLFGFLIVSLVLMQGCPGAGSAFIGMWLLTVNGTDYGLEVLPNGEATSFAVNATLGGTLKWFADGDQFIMNQDNSGIALIYSGRLSMDGEFMVGARVIWLGQNQGTGATWSAARI